MKAARNVIGEKFGKLTAISREARKASGGQTIAVIVCKCECGNTLRVDRGNLIKGHSKSCGCGKGSYLRASKTRHGLCGTKIYRTYRNMLSRCYNSRVGAYGRYGGRGITVCERWRRSFDNFVEDMGLPPSPRHSIDRIDNELGYSPDNCRWALHVEQLRNFSRNRLVEYKGESRPVNEWAELHNIPRIALWLRLFRYKWPIEKALTTPVRQSSR